MDLISMVNMHNYTEWGANDIWDEEDFTYVGRSRNALLLGNPWCHTESSQAKFHVPTLQQALNNYREWLFKKIINNLICAVGKWNLEAWEIDYTTRLIALTKKVKDKQVKRIGCWCIEVEKYIPVLDGDEKCHAEILYKGCLLLIEKGIV